MLWKWTFRVASLLFIASLLLYYWWYGDSSNVLTILCLSFGGVLLFASSFIGWSYLFLCSIASLVTFWEKAKHFQREQHLQTPDLIPYSDARCSSCKAYLQRDAKYCLRCGNPTTMYFWIKYCPGCNQTLPFDACYCTQCRYQMVILEKEQPEQLQKKEELSGLSPKEEKKDIAEAPTEPVSLKMATLTRKLPESNSMSSLEKLASGKFNFKTTIY